MVMKLAVQVLPAIFPWVRHLPDDEKQEFVAEWLDTLRAAADLDNNAAVEGVVAAWRSTAEVYADPELYAILTREHDGPTTARCRTPVRRRVSPKRGDRASRRRRPGEWDVRFKESDAARGWEELCRQAPGNTLAAWETMRRNPAPPMDAPRHHRLKGSLATRRW